MLKLSGNHYIYIVAIAFQLVPTCYRKYHNRHDNFNLPDLMKKAMRYGRTDRS